MRKALSLLLILFSCSSSPSSSSPSVLVSFPPYAYLVQRITGELVKVETLVPPETNPHVYEPSPKQIQSIFQVQIWFRLGEPMEKKILKVLREKNRELLSVDLSEGISLISSESHVCDHVCHHGHHHHHEALDRHIWMSPRLAKIQAQTIFNTLCKIYPNYREQFQRGFDELAYDLEQLDEELSKELAPFAGDAILVSHPAFGYYCAAYRLKQLSIEWEGKDPLPQDIEKTVKEAKNTHVQSILTQPQYNNKAAILIGEQLHLPVYEVDPYSQDYIQNLRHITELIAHDPSH